MLKDIVSIGDKIELSRFSYNDSQTIKPKIYFSQVLDFIEYDKACIAMPIEGSRIIPLSVGDKYQLCFYCKQGLYQCRAVVTDRYRKDNIYMLVVQLASELEKFQRRQFYRLEYVLEILVCRLLQSEVDKKKEEIDISPNRYLDAMMLDISGGGCKFILNELIEKDTKVMLRFTLTLARGMRMFEVLGRITNSGEQLNRSKSFEHRVEFIELLEEDREHIVRFIFDEERRRRRKEKGLD
jgi:c-di-GMP-binding flagellar brake protein YcgR